jgi:hypothetical protein
MAEFTPAPGGLSLPYRLYNRTDCEQCSHSVTCPSCDHWYSPDLPHLRCHNWTLDPLPDAPSNRCAECGKSRSEVPSLEPINVLDPDGLPLLVGEYCPEHKAKWEERLAPVCDRLQKSRDAKTFKTEIEATLRKSAEAIAWVDGVLEREQQQEAADKAEREAQERRDWIDQHMAAERDTKSAIPSPNTSDIDLDVLRIGREILRLHGQGILASGITPGVIRGKVTGLNPKMQQRKIRAFLETRGIPYKPRQFWSTFRAWAVKHPEAFSEKSP